MKITNAHKIATELSTKAMGKLYKSLDVNLTLQDADPESLYGGYPHPVTGEVLSEQYQIPAMLNDLFGGIKKAGPMCIDKWGVVWPKGNGIPLYKYNYKGTMTITSKFILDVGYPPHPIKGKLLCDGTKGLGVTLPMALTLWGIDKVAALPIERD